MDFHGIGVPKDLVEGYIWLSLGAKGLEKRGADKSPLRADALKTELGAAAQAATEPFDNAALELFERLKGELTREQMAEAQKRIAAFDEKKDRH